MNAPERNLKLSLRRTGELAGIVRVNEEIKAIVATAFRINLMALNAIFLAKRAGNAALGFGVLSNELRRFAQDLTRHMSSLRDMTSGSVGSVTGVVQQHRTSRILAEAIRLSGDGVPGVREARRRGAARLAQQVDPAPAAVQFVGQVQHVARQAAGLRVGQQFADQQHAPGRRSCRHDTPAQRRPMPRTPLPGAGDAVESVRVPVADAVLPTLVVVDKKGKVREIFIGVDDAAKVEAVVQALLAE